MKLDTEKLRLSNDPVRRRRRRAAIGEEEGYLPILSGLSAPGTARWSNEFFVERIPCYALRESAVLGRIHRDAVYRVLAVSCQVYDASILVDAEVISHPPGDHKFGLSRRIVRLRINGYTHEQLLGSRSVVKIIRLRRETYTNGQWRAAFGNYEHEQIGEKQGHLEPKSVEALIAGLPTSFTDLREQSIYELALALANHRVVPTGLYKRCKELLGDAGIVDVTVLMGWFTMVSLTLMAYDVPSNAVGIDQ